MTTVNCAAAVRKAFPGAEITENVLSYRGAVYVHCIPDKFTTTIDGDLSTPRVMALAYYLTHRDEFKQP